MSKNHYAFVRQKKTRKRIIIIALICIVFSIVTVTLREYTQNITEPLNKGYHPFDKQDDKN